MATSMLIVEDEPEFLQRFSEAVHANPSRHLIAGVTTGRAVLDCWTPSRPMCCWSTSALLPST